MNTQMTNGFWQRNRLVLKAIFIGFLSLALLIPTLFIMFLVQDRELRRDEVLQEVSSKWAGAQTVTGPFLAVPYYVDFKNEQQVTVQQKKYVFLLPDELQINGKIAPLIKNRSIFKVPVYNSVLNITGKFSRLKTDKLPVSLSAMHFDESLVCMGISDFKGIGENLRLNWNSAVLDFETGLPEISWLQTGIHCPVKLTADSISGADQSFSIQLQLKGSRSLNVIPVGNKSTVHFESSWQHPAFDGMYLPDTSIITTQGFTADWKVLLYNRTYPQYFTSVNESKIQESAFGLNLFQPVDGYAQTQRCIKYAVLIIALTFFLYFFLEICYKRNVHPLKYILIGFALVIFYTLLLSFSEFLSFAQSYLVASVSTILLISWYTASIFRKPGVVLIFSLVIALLYLFVYVLIQLQDNALLFGSIGLFMLLAVIMHFSNKINWTNDTAAQEAEEGNQVFQNK